MRSPFENWMRLWGDARSQDVRQTWTTMTEPEADGLAARLTRIWEPILVEENYWRDAGFPKGFRYTGYVRDDVRLVGDDEEQWLNFALQFQDRFLNFGNIFIAATTEQRLVDLALMLGEIYVQTNGAIIEEWLPFFRRDCWLSGLPIEASAHEKAEWIQGFSAEELEAWNLKV